MSGKVRIRALSRSRENRMFADALLRYILVEVLLPDDGHPFYADVVLPSFNHPDGQKLIQQKKY